MSTTVNVYRNTDASASSLKGTVGTLTTILDACLVNGYGSQTAAGWTIAYSGTNKRVYRNSTTDGTGFYIYVDDSGSGSGGAKEALMTGFQSATGVGTGTGQFPTFAQSSNGIGAVVCRKSNTADSTVRSWTLIADDTVFYLFCENDDYTNPITPSMFIFGDFFSNAITDPYRCIIVGRSVENNSNYTYAWESITNGWFSSTYYQVLTATLSGHFIASNFTGVGGSILCGKHIDTLKLGITGVSSEYGTTSSSVQNWSEYATIGMNYEQQNAMNTPNQPDVAIYMSSIRIHHNGMIRGYFKGLWAPCQNLPMTHNDTWTGTGPMTGKSFLAQFLTGSSGPGEIFIETSSTWS